MSLFQKYALFTLAMQQMFQPKKPGLAEVDNAFKPSGFLPGTAGAPYLQKTLNQRQKRKRFRHETRSKH